MGSPKQVRTARPTSGVATEDRPSPYRGATTRVREVPVLPPPGQCDSSPVSVLRAESEETVRSTPSPPHKVVVPTPPLGSRDWGTPEVVGVVTSVSFAKSWWVTLLGSEDDTGEPVVGTPVDPAE